jgi:hypothetical protein
VAAAAAVVVAAAVPPVASSGEYDARLVSPDNQLDGGAQHVQDGHHAQPDQNEGPSAHEHGDAARGATKLRCAQNPCEQDAALWAWHPRLQRHQSRAAGGVSAAAGGWAHFGAHGAAARRCCWGAATWCRGQVRRATSAAGRGCLPPSRRSPNSESPGCRRRPSRLVVQQTNPNARTGGNRTGKNGSFCGLDQPISTLVMVANP